MPYPHGPGHERGRAISTDAMTMCALLARVETEGLQDSSDTQLRVRTRAQAASEGNGQETRGGESAASLLQGARTNTTDSVRRVYIEGLCVRDRPSRGAEPQRRCQDDSCNGVWWRMWNVWACQCGRTCVRWYARPMADRREEVVTAEHSDGPTP